MLSLFAIIDSMPDTLQQETTTGMCPHGNFQDSCESCHNKGYASRVADAIVRVRAKIEKGESIKKIEENDGALLRSLQREGGKLFYDTPTIRDQFIEPIEALLKIITPPKESESPDTKKEKAA